MIDQKKLWKWYYIVVCVLAFPFLAFGIWGRINRDQLMQLEHIPLWIKIGLTITFILFYPAYIAAFWNMIKTRWLFWAWIILHTALAVLCIIVFWF